MKILITGAGGFIAGNVAGWLRQNSEHEIICIYRNHAPKDTSLKSVRCDLFWEPEKLSGIDYDAVVHFASQLYGKRIEDFLDNTVEATRNLIWDAQSKGVKVFIYISSISIYGETSGRIHEASDRVNLNDYEITKWIGERLVEDSCFEHKIIIRLPRMLGKGIDYTASWLPKISYAIMKNQDVQYYNPDLKYNAVCHTDDLAKFIKYCIDTPVEKMGKYILGAGGEMTIREILELLKRELNSTSNLILVKSRDKNRCHLVDITRAKEAGFESSTVEKTLKKYVGDMKEGSGRRFGG